MHESDFLLINRNVHQKNLFVSPPPFFFLKKAYGVMVRALV